MSTNDSRPNFLLIIADQYVLDAISAYRSHLPHPAWGCHWVHTPHIDRLVNHGVSFLRSASVNPVCCPARSSLFTGRMSIETGVTVNNVGIAEDLPNLGEWLNQHSDYERVYAGKWHAGGPWGHPHVDGHRKIPGFDILPAMDTETGHLLDEEVSGNIEAYLDGYSGKRPFLAVASLLNPHDICFWTPKYGAENDVPVAADGIFDVGDELPVLPPNHDVQLRTPERVADPVTSYSPLTWQHYSYDYYRMVEQVDRHIGRMLDAVDRRSDETIVIFTSDHGEGLGRHRRVQKWHPFEESLSVPLVFYSPNRISEGSVNDSELVSTVDIMSTVCDYAGIPDPPLTRGGTLRPYLDVRPPHPASSVTTRANIYAEVQITGRVIRTRQFKYVKYYRYSGDWQRPFVRRSDGSATQFEPGHGHHYAEDPVKLFFDLENDPWETRNLYTEQRYQPVIDEHAEMLQAWEEVLIPGAHFNR